MEARELRIGNLIKSGKGIYKVISISHYKDSTDIITVSNDGVVIPYPCTYKPIPITEEWLLQFGFEYFEENNSYQLFTEFGFYIWGRINDGFNIYVNSDEVGENIKYIHTLQNIYFALTGTEL